jgi:hypothetical protein
MMQFDQDRVGDILQIETFIDSGASDVCAVGTTSVTAAEGAVHPNVAAQALGISVNDVYERIRRGELSAEKRGNRWVVILPLAKDHRRPTDGPAQPRPTANDEISAHADAIQHLRLEEHDAAIEEIRARLALLEVSIRQLTAARAVAPSPPATTSTASLPARERRTTFRLPDVRPRLMALTAIVGLTLSGVAIQGSSAQRSDDLTTAFVFACGGVTGAIAAWLASGKRETPRSESEPKPVERVARPVSAELIVRNSDD